jgi:hypothetical protein
MVTGTFRAYPQQQREVYYLIGDSLDQGPTAAAPHNLGEIIGSNDALLSRPQDLVCHEQGASCSAPMVNPDLVGKGPVKRSSRDCRTLRGMVAIPDVLAPVDGVNSASACSSHNRISISRYIVVAVTMGIQSSLFRSP